MASDKIDDVARILRTLDPKDVTRALKRAYPDAKLPALVPGKLREDFDPEDVEKLAQLNCTIAEAASFFSVARSTFARRLEEPIYRQAWERGQDATKRALRRKQIQRALVDGSDTMLIWLGKVMLDQKERPEAVAEESRAEVAIDMVELEELMEDAIGEVIDVEYEEIAEDAGSGQDGEVPEGGPE